MAPSSPWITGGDFDIIGSSEERLSIAQPDYKAIDEFNLFQHDAELRNAGFQGSIYTWCNDHPVRKVWERLNRILLNAAASVELPNFLVIHENRILSDHCPLIGINPVLDSPKYKSGFKFQTMWTTHHSFLEAVENNWQIPCPTKPMVRVQLKLKRLKFFLKMWN